MAQWWIGKGPPARGIDSVWTLARTESRFGVDVPSTHSNPSSYSYLLLE